MEFINPWGVIVWTYSCIQEGLSSIYEWYSCICLLLSYLRAPILCQSLCLMMLESSLVIKENDFCSEEAICSPLNLMWWQTSTPSFKPHHNGPLGEELGCEVRNSERINCALLVKVFELITHWFLFFFSNDKPIIFISAASSGALFIFRDEVCPLHRELQTWKGKVRIIENQ